MDVQFKIHPSPQPSRNVGPPQWGEGERGPISCAFET